MISRRPITANHSPRDRHRSKAYHDGYVNPIHTCIKGVFNSGIRNNPGFEKVSHRNVGHPAPDVAGNRAYRSTCVNSAKKGPGQHKAGPGLG